MSEQAPASRSRRRSPAARFARLAVAGAAIVFSTAALAFCFTPVWLPTLSRHGWAPLDFERFVRILRYSAGWTMPGQPDLTRLPARLAGAQVRSGAPVFIRIFKREFELELWMKGGQEFRRLATYPVCMWSGDLGPKLKEGDGQAPEGVYTVDAAALNPNSKYYRAFNLGFPNALDRAQGRTGSLIMVHGNCVSIGCFAMTNAQIDEIWRLVTAALGGGQQRFQVQVFPFRPTEDNLAREAGSPNAAFWRTLKTGYDLFEATRVPPEVSFCAGNYVFGPGAKGSKGDAAIKEACAASGKRG